MENKDGILREIEIENYIWIVYLVLIITSYWANNEEAKYFLFNDMRAKSKYRGALIFIFSVACVIYYYFFQSSYKSYKSLTKYDSDSKIFFETINFIGAVLVLIAGIIFLFIAIFDEHIETEIAF